MWDTAGTAGNSPTRTSRARASVCPSWGAQNLWKKLYELSKCSGSGAHSPRVSTDPVRVRAGGLKSSASPRRTPRNAPIMTLNQTPLLPLIGPGRGEGRGQHGRSHGPPTPPPIFRGSKLGERPAQELSQRQPTTAQNKQAFSSLQPALLGALTQRLLQLLDLVSQKVPQLVGWSP